MRRFNILTLMMGVTIALTACSAKDDAILGSRDDIIIMNKGVPVGETQMASAEAPSAPEMITTPRTEAVGETQMASAEGAAAVEATTENISEIDAEVAEAAEAVAKAERELAAAQGLTEATPVVTEAQNVDVAPMKDAVETKAEEVVASIEQPVAEITEATMSKPDATEAMAPFAAAPTASAVPVSEVPMQSTVPVEDPVTETVPEKVAGGCYKQTLIPAVIDASGKVTELPKVEERRIVCLDKMNDGLVAIVQNALMDKGYDIKKADGVLGSKTSAALESYQRKNGLGLGGFTYETLESLGIKL